MTETLTINLTRPIAAVQGLGLGANAPDSVTVPEQLAAAFEREQRQKLECVEQQKNELAQACQTVNTMATRLDELYTETLAHNRSDIAKLAVEIARKILMHKTREGDYAIEAIVAEALKRAPTRQEIVVRVNPEDLPACQQFQEEDPKGPFAELNLVADWSIARADCVIETPKGIVKSFIEEHLERISEALGKVG